MSAATLLIVAKLPPERRRTLEIAAHAAGFELHVIHDWKIAASWAARNEPRAVLLDARLSTAQELCYEIRGQRGLAKVAVIALAPEHNDLLSEQYYSWGVDDVVPAEAGAPLIERLSIVGKTGRIGSTTRRGRAVIADPHSSRNDVVGRVLHNAGYELSYASDERKLLAEVMQRAPVLVVASAAIGAPRELIQAARRVGSHACWVVTTPKRDIGHYLQALSDLDRVAVTSALGPVENVLFLSNEMLRGRTELARRSSRMLCGTIVRFRPAGDSEDDTGFTYNVSVDGMYVRTLGPPTSETLWLELSPPYQRARVRLLGKVAWRRSFGDNALATVPAGFGVEVVEGLGNGLTLWRRGVESLLATTGTTENDAAAAERPLVGRVVSLPVGTPALPNAAGARAVVETEPSTRPGPTGEQSASGPAPGAPRAAVEAAEREPVAELPASEPLVEARTVDESASGADVAALGEERAFRDGATRRKARSPWALFAMVGMVSGGALFGGYRALRSRSGPPSSRPVPASSAKIRAPARQGTGAQAAVDATPKTDPVRDAAAPTPTEDAGRVLAEPEALVLAQLSARDAYLFVEYADHAHVYLNGIDAGATNQWLAVKCGTWFIRVGTAAKVPTWLTVGQSTQVPCGRAKRVAFRPSP